WDDPRIFQDSATEGGWYPAPDSAGFRAFSTRYRAKYGQEPVRTATLAYDAVALVAALVKTQGTKRFAPDTLTNASGFAGIDGVFRFRADGTNQRGLAVLKATPSGGQVVSPAPRSFNGSGTERSAWPAAGGLIWPLSRPVRHHRVEHRKSRARHPQPAVCGGLNKSVPRECGDPLEVERAACQRRVALRIDPLGEPQPHQQELVGLLVTAQRVVDRHAVA